MLIVPLAVLVGLTVCPPGAAAFAAGVAPVKVATADDDSGKDSGLWSSVKGVFGGGGSPQSHEKPPASSTDVPDREKLPKGKNDPVGTREKEVSGMHTANMRVWKTSTGKYSADMTAEPNWYKEDGSWHTISPEVTTANRAGFKLQNDTNLGQSWFSEDPDDLVRYREPDSGNEIGLSPANSGKSKLTPKKGDTDGSNQVTYDGAFSGQEDLQYTTKRGGLQEDIVLAKAPAAGEQPVYRFRLDTGGLTPVQRKDGSIEVVNSLLGMPVFTLPAAYMRDSKKSNADPYGTVSSDQVTQKLVKVKDTATDASSAGGTGKGSTSGSSSSPGIKLPDLGDSKSGSTPSGGSGRESTDTPSEKPSPSSSSGSGGGVLGRLGAGLSSKDAKAGSSSASPSSTRTAGEGASDSKPAAKPSSSTTPSSASSSSGAAGAVEKPAKRVPSGAPKGYHWEVVITPDAGWLRAPDREYPVNVDPSLEIQPGPDDAQDAAVASGDPDTNYDSQNLRAGKADVNKNWRSLVKFPINQIPAGAKIDSAMVGMYYTDTWVGASNAFSTDIHRMTGNWSESTATWNNTDKLVGERSVTTVQLDDGDTGTAATGSWTVRSSESQAAYGIDHDYRFNQDTHAGDTYTWQPKVGQTGTYQVWAHSVGSSNRATNAPYTVTDANETYTSNVDQSGDLEGKWTELGTTERQFTAGTTGKIVLKDTPATADIAVIADAVKLTNPGSVYHPANQQPGWYQYPVTDTVQQWLNGTYTNYGFAIGAHDESTTGPIGAVIMDSGDGSFGGETENLPKLMVTWGRPGVRLNAPTTVHSTGPELSWPAYSPPAGDTGAAIAGYELHRSTKQTFTPSSSTLVASIGKDATSYTDTSATPTPDDADSETASKYYYQLAVRTTDGELIPSAPREVAVPKAGHTLQTIRGSSKVTDTTIASGRPSTNLDQMAANSSGAGTTSVVVGNNDPTDKADRMLARFDTTSVPKTAQVVSAKLNLDSTITNNTNADGSTCCGSDEGATGASYEIAPLSQPFDETTATWNNANSSTKWNTAGGDYGSVESAISCCAARRGRWAWTATSMAKDWVSDPSSNNGLIMRVKDEAAKQERTVFTSSENADPLVSPQLQVVYTDPTPQDTYYAPQTPGRMTPSTTYTTPVTVTNTTGTAWAEGERELGYHWTTRDGVTIPNEGDSQLFVDLPALAPGESATVDAKVKAPPSLSDDRVEYDLGWDVHNKAATNSSQAWLSQDPGIDPLVQPVAVETDTADQLGLEAFYAYQSAATGAGTSLSTNLATGNAVWQDNLWSNPGRELTAFARVAYNSGDSADTGFGPGWSSQLSGPIRTGDHLQAWPLDVAPTRVTLPDGDGTSHVFRKKDDGTWQAPPGVNYQLSVADETDTTEPDGDSTGILSPLDCLNLVDPPDDYFTLLRPDGTRFMFDCGGWLTKTVSKNGAEQDFTYDTRLSANITKRFLTKVTDPAGRTVTQVTYNSLGSEYDYIDASGQVAQGSVLEDTLALDKVSSITDVSGRTTKFLYDQAGYLRRIVDGDGTDQAKTFKFDYSDIQLDTLTAKLTSITDPRGHVSKVDYTSATDDTTHPDQWGRVKTFTDRLDDPTGFTYANDSDNTGDGTGQGDFTDTTVTDAEDHATKYVLDGYARPTKLTNAKSETTTLAWDADNNVKYLKEPNGAERAYCYDPKTGYPIWALDAIQADKNGGVPDDDTCDPDATAQDNADNAPDGASVYEYQTRADGYAADIFRTTSPAGRQNQFSYDSYGNLLTVTDGDGLATDTSGDYTTTYAYSSDVPGQLASVTDANGNVTKFSDYSDVGYPKTTTDALGHDSTATYDSRGLVTRATDAGDGVQTQDYDVFGRPLAGTEKVSDDKTITTPAPTYDANDNVTESVAPNGAVSTATYDAADQITASTTPKDDDSSGTPTTSYVYDKVGNLLKQVEPKGTASTDDDSDYVTSYGYDEVYQQTSVTNAEGDEIQYSYDSVGNQIEVDDPTKTASDDPDDYTTKTAYDLDHQPVKVTDAKGAVTATTYDADGYATKVTDAEGNTTTTEYDARGAKISEQAPRTGTGDSATYRTTRWLYDQVGNTTAVVSPRGVASGVNDTQGTGDGSGDAYTTRYTYDALNRKIRQYQPYNADDDRYNDPNVYTETSYDAAGHPISTSLPPSQGQSKRNTTSVSYYANGWIKSSTDAWGIKTAYEYDDLGDQTARTLTGTDGTTKRTMTWSYYPDGKLKSHGDDGVPVGSESVTVDNDDPGVTDANGTWDTTTATDAQGGEARTHAAATDSDATYTWTLDVPADGTYNLAATWPTVDGAASDASYTLTTGTGDSKQTKTYTADQTTGAGAWNTLDSSVQLTKGEAVTVSLKASATGTVAADSVRLVRDNSADTDNEHKAFAYGYDLNGNLTGINDTSSDTGTDEYTMAYNGLDQITSVKEALAGQEKATTSYTYDSLGDPLTVKHPDQSSEYTYDDPRHLLTKVSVDDAHDGDKPAKTTSYTYDLLGRAQEQTKGNGNVVSYDYQPDSAVSHQEENTSAGALVASHDYTYDANGNQTQDAAKKRSGDDAGTVLSSTIDYSYDPVDRLAEKDKSGHAASTESYVHDANANVVSQVIDSDSTDLTPGDETDYTYDRNRLTSAVINPGAAGDNETASYRYDAFGRQVSVTADTAATDPKTISRTAYDGFDHVKQAEKLPDNATTNSDLVTTKYTYDPLDRRTSQTTHAGTDQAKTTDYSYLGLSKEVIGDKVAGQLTKTYQYTPWGQRLSQISQTDDSAKDTQAGDTGYYSYNSHSDVETVTDDSGSTKATYGYTAYGQTDKAETTGVDKPDDGTCDPSDPVPTDPCDPGQGDKTDQYNAFRFNADRLDPANDTYDMGFRDYDPSLNTFTTRDSYNGALDDLDLATDPYTGSRYAYGAGNPISMVDLDGHRPVVVGPDGQETDDQRYTQQTPKNDGSGTFVASSGSSSGGGTSDTTPQIKTVHGSAPVSDPESHTNLCDGPHGFIPCDPGKPIIVTPLQQKLAIAGAAVDGGTFACAILWEVCAGVAASALDMIPGAENVSAASGASAGGAGAGITAGIVKLFEKLTGKSGAAVTRTGETAAEACSFSGTTLVLMADGSKKPIEKVKKGDKVLATDPETGEQVPKRVTGTIKHWDRMSDLVLEDGARLTTTEDHRYWSVDDQRFEQADELSPGERVLSADGRTVKVAGLEWVTGRYGWAYNLSVDNIHTYHVGDDEILVHNSCLAALKGWSSQRFQFGNSQFQLDKRGMTHILQRHHPNYWDGSAKAKQSFFESSMSIEDVQSAIGDVARQNRSALMEIGGGSGQVQGSVNGVNYVLGVSRGRIGQFYPGTLP